MSTHDINYKLWIPDGIETEEEAIDFVKNSVVLWMEDGSFEFQSIYNFGEMLYMTEKDYEALEELWWDLWLRELQVF